MHEHDTRIAGSLAPAAGAGGSGGDGMTPNPKLNSSTQNQLGQGLRVMYDDLLRGPIPEHLLALLDQDASPKEMH
jgi:anti-sigma factor NepR-like protein